MEIVIRKKSIIASKADYALQNGPFQLGKFHLGTRGNPVKEKNVLFREPDILIEFLISSSSSAPHQCSDSKNRVIGLHLLRADYTRNRLPNPSLPRNRHPDPVPKAEPSSELFPSPLPSSEPSSWTAFFGTVFLIDGLRRNRL